MGDGKFRSSTQGQRLVGWVPSPPKNDGKNKGIRHAERPSTAKDRLRNFMKERKQEPPSQRTVDEKILDLLSTSVSITQGARSSFAACPTAVNIKTLLSTKVSSFDDLTASVWEPLMEIFKAGRIADIEHPFTFSDVFFHHFFEQCTEPGSTSHLALLSELLSTHHNNKVALQNSIANMENERAQLTTVEELNEFLIVQASMWNKNFAQSMEGAEVILYDDVASMTDPMPPDPVLTQQISELQRAMMIQKATSKLVADKLRSEAWATSSALAKTEAKYDALVEEQRNMTHATAGPEVDTNHMGTQTDGMEKSVAAFEDAMNFTLPDSDFCSSPKLFSPISSSHDSFDKYSSQLELQLRLKPEIAPLGFVALVFTDIQSSTFLWNLSPTGMRRAIKEHNILMRAAIKRFNGYEVKTEGDAFMVSFHNTLDACKWCCETQVQLQDMDWPEEVLGVEDTTDEIRDEEGILVFRGLRIRMGIHYDEPLCEEDPTTNRMDYFGPVVNFAARVSSKGRGGEVVMSVDAYEAVKDILTEEHSTKYISCGAVIFEHEVFELKGFSDGVLLYHIFANALVNRRFFFKKDPPPEKAVIENRIPAPMGDVSLVFTDIQSSTYLWNQTQDGMITSIALHNEHLRGLMLETNGYEVKTEGDAFMIAFEFTEDAAKWCMQTQMLLLALEWPDSLLELEVARPAPRTDGGCLWRGVRVRMGIHAGWPLCQTDPTTGRMDYFGPVVNKAARVSGCGRGGETVVSIDAAQRLEPLLMTDEIVDGGVTMWTLPAVNLKGFSDEEVLQAIVPTVLSERMAEFMLAREPPEPPKVEIQALNEEQKQKLEALERKLELSEKNAPKGEVSLLCAAAHTTGLWNNATVAMIPAVELLSDLYRTMLDVHSGYVVNANGDTLVAAFQERKAALSFANDVQLGALDADWPLGLLEVKEAERIEQNGSLLWNGLKIKIAVLTGTPQARTDPITLRMDYYGPVMAATTKLMALVKPGETLVSMHDIYAFKEDLDLCITTMGEVALTTGMQDCEVFQVLPLSLQGRVQDLVQIKAIDDGRFEQLSSNTKAPVGEVSVVFVDVENAMDLWNNVPELMAEASAIKTRVLAKNAKAHAYHVMNEGDASMFTFQTAKHAIRWCLNVQLGLLAMTWPKGLGEQLGCSTLRDRDGKVVRKGLRLKIAMATGVVLTEVNEATGRTSYKGNVINNAARILQYVNGGDVLCEQDTIKSIGETSLQMMIPGGVTITERQFEGTHVASVLPSSLKCNATTTNLARTFGVARHFFKSQMTQSQQEAINHLEQSGRSSMSFSQAEQTVVCFDFIDCYTMWRDKEQKIRVATKIFTKAVNAITIANQGIVARGLNDAFVAVFANAADAVSFALQVQVTIISIQWPHELGDELTVVNNIALWRGPRVRMAIKRGTPMMETYPETGKKYIFGYEVDDTADLLASARGGEILCKERLWTEAQEASLHAVEVESGHSLQPEMLKDRVGMLKPALNNAGRFSIFESRPYPQLRGPSCVVVVQTPVEDAPECFQVLTKNMQGTVMIFEGSCLVLAFERERKMLEWCCDICNYTKDHPHLMMKMGITYGGIPEGPVGAEKLMKFPEKIMRRASKLCEAAKLGEVLLTETALEYLSNVLTEMGFSAGARDAGPGHVLLLADPTPVKTGSLPGPWFTWHIARVPVIQTEHVSKKELTKVQRIRKHTYMQRMTVIGGTLTVLASLENDTMACYDENLLEKPPRAAEAIHLLSIHYRTMQQMIEGPTSIHFVDEMKNKAMRLNAVLHERGLVPRATRMIEQVKMEAFRLWFQSMQAAPRGWDTEPDQLDKELVAIHKLVHDFVKLVVRYFAQPLEGVDIQEHNLEHQLRWLEHIGDDGESQHAPAQRIKAQTQSVCCGSVSTPSKATKCVGSILLKVLCLGGNKQAAVIKSLEKDVKEDKKEKKEKKEEKEEKVDLNKLLMGALLPGVQKNKR